MAGARNIQNTGREVPHSVPAAMELFPGIPNAHMSQIVGSAYRAIAPRSGLKREAVRAFHWLAVAFVARSARLILQGHRVSAEDGVEIVEHVSNFSLFEIRLFLRHVSKVDRDQESTHCHVTLKQMITV